MTDDEADSVEAGGAGRTDPGKSEEEATAEDWRGITGLPVTQRASVKSEGVEKAGIGGEEVPKRFKS